MKKAYKFQRIIASKIIIRQFSVVILTPSTYMTQNSIEIQDQIKPLTYTSWCIFDHGLLI